MPLIARAHGPRDKAASSARVAGQASIPIQNMAMHGSIRQGKRGTHVPRCKKEKELKSLADATGTAGTVTSCGTTDNI